MVGPGFLFAAMAALLASQSSIAQSPSASLPQAPPIKPPPAVSSASAVKTPAKQAGPKAKNDVLFEGYSKVLLSGTHVGFIVQRYEFDPTKQEFIGSYLLKTNTIAGGITESLKARSTATFKPLGYQYTEMVGQKTKTIDASFANDIMVAQLKEGDRPAVTIRKNVPKGAFLSSFLVYMMLNGKEGIKPGVRYGFVAIAEEEAEVHPGEASVASQETINGMTAFKVFNTFKGVKFASFVNAKGDVLATRSPAQSISTELVASVQEATAGIAFNPHHLAILFGSMPEGKINAVAKQEKSPEPVAPASGDSLTTKTIIEASEGDVAPPKANEATPPRTKGEGIKGGQGVMIKGAPAAESQ